MSRSSGAKASYAAASYSSIRRYPECPSAAGVPLRRRTGAFLIMRPGANDRERDKGDARRGEADDLPEREVPRHDCEHDTERLVDDVALGRVRAHRLSREKVLAVLRVVAARERALGRFLDRRSDGLPHLERHEPT